MTTLKPLAVLACAGVVLCFGCEEDVDSFEGYEVVSGEHEAIVVAVVQDDDGDLPVGASSRELPTESGESVIATAQISPVVVPASYSAYASDSEERVTVVVQVDDPYVNEVDRVELLVAVGSGESISGIELDEEALTPGRFFAFLKPSCLTDLRADDGTCQLDSIAECSVEIDGEVEIVQGRCDAFTFRLWRDPANDAEVSPTPTTDPGSAALEESFWVVD